MHKHPITLALLLLLLINNSINAQDSTYFTFEGNILQHGSNQPLAYVHLAFDNNRMGTITNLQGQFKMQLHNYYKNSSVTISHLGHESQVITIGENPEPVTIYLKEYPQILEEVTVTDLTAEDIIKQAIDKIPENYYDQPYISKGFYRTTSRKKDEYIQLSEAEFDIFHSRHNNDNNLRLEKIRSIKDEQLLKDINIGTTPNSLIQADFVNHLNSFDLLNKKGFKYHRFTLDYTSTFNGEKVYVISFDQKPTLKKAKYKGFMYIEIESLAIVHMNFGLSPRGIEHYKVGSAAMRTLMKILNIDITLLDSQIETTYRKIGNRFYFSEMKQSKKYHMVSDKKNYDYVIDLHTDYFVSNFQLENHQPFGKEEIMKGNRHIEFQPSLFEQEYWVSHNILLPDFDFPTEAKMIADRNKTIEE